MSFFFGFDMEKLPPPIEAFLQSTNPWWRGNPMRPLPPYRRWAFSTILQRIQSGLAPAVVLRGPRQVGKTTLQEQVITYLLDKEKIDPSRILRVQFDELPSLRRVDDPILALCRWFENRVLGKTFNTAASEGSPAYLFFDEVQNLGNWAPQIKSLVDNHAVRVLVTGSSALRIELGHDSLAGRITQLDLGPLLLREIAGIRDLGELKAFLPTNGLSSLLEADFWGELKSFGSSNYEMRDAAFAAFAERGGYPMAQVRTDRPWEEIANHLNETVIQRAIQHDLRLGERGKRRDSSLLEEVFRLACRYAGQSPGQAVFVNEVKSALAANIGWQRILAYLKFLDGTLLLRLVPPLELRIRRSKGNSKICLSDHTLRASWLQESVPLTASQLQNAPHLADLAGHLAESIVGYFLGNLPDLPLRHFPARGAEPEVDYVLTIGEKRIPLEVKYRQRIDPLNDTVGLRAFLENRVYNAPFGVLVTLSDNVAISDPRIVTLPLSSLLLLR